MWFMEIIFYLSSIGKFILYCNRQERTVLFYTNRVWLIGMDKTDSIYKIDGVLRCIPRQMTCNFLCILKWNYSELTKELKFYLQPHFVVHVSLMSHFKWHRINSKFFTDIIALKTGLSREASVHNLQLYSEFCLDSANRNRGFRKWF